MIAIIDYGAGNLHSVKNALDFIRAPSKITGDASEILAADKVILPGVGAFGDTMECLERDGLDKVVKQIAAAGIPLLGICMGLQLMFEESEESPGAKGLGLFKGRIVRIPDRGLKIPHMGWNNIEIAKESRILRNIGDTPFVYFVHSYYVQPEDGGIASAYTEYGEKLTVAVESGNVFAVQFHPEKSGDMGMRILRNFISL
ncbi:MAG: imidazole glycerol phosphate synthase subunit HisH [Oscillospiraceae bacterium]|nr:imidazole glycerol phosphate synthase subunit HisH [Oscillospiraceae bacterium]